MTDPLAERLAELERARQDADRLYNDALTALDRSLATRPEFPHPPPAYDSAKLGDVNRVWDILPLGAPVIDRSLKGRLRAAIWRLVGPPLETQRQFNAALADHLNRNVQTHEETSRAVDSVIAFLKDRINGELAFQSHLIQLMQTVTLYVDTRDRATAGGQDVLNAGLNAVTDTWLKHWESLSAREARFVDRLSVIDDVRTTAALAQQAALSLKREVEKLLAGTTGTTGDTSQLTPPTSSGSTNSASAARRRAEGSKTQAAEHDSRFVSPVEPVVPEVPTPDLNAFKYLGFEDQFRGSVDDIRRRLTEYVPLFQGQTDVLDIGCGRGEFLELLRVAGIRARGLDINLAMVEASRARGLDVAQGDALGYVSDLADGALGGLFAAQVAEHLTPDYLAALLEAAAHKIRPGGVIVLETINPACWVAFFESYIRDLTHVRPLHPQTLQYLVRVSGFQEVSIAFKSPVAESDRLHRVAPPSPDAPEATTDFVETLNDNIEKLNARLFTYQDYAVIGRK